jgi:hypothetical protein
MIPLRVDLRDWSGGVPIAQSERDAWVYEIMEMFQKDPKTERHHISRGAHTVVGLRYGTEILIMDCQMVRRGSVYIED